MGTRPLDLATSEDRRFLYARDPGAGGINTFRIEPDGTLVNLGSTAAGLPLFAQGIAVR